MHGQDDVLGSLLDIQRLHTVIAGRIDLSSPWRIDGSPTDLLVIQVQVSGCSHVQRPGAEPVMLNPGDIALYPHGVVDSYMHDGSHPPRATLMLTVPSGGAAISAPLRLSDGKADASLIVCLMRVEQKFRGALWGNLPYLVHISPRSLPRPGQLAGVVELMIEESEQPGPASTRLLSRLAEIVLILALRHEAYTDASGPGLRALSDAAIAPALELIHDDPGRGLSVSTLASVCGMSRSAFAARFTSSVGQSPSAYVAEWRMSVAARLLATTDDTVGRIAEAVGYRSEAAFRNAFFAAVRMSPRAYRRSCLQRS